MTVGCLEVAAVSSVKVSRWSVLFASLIASLCCSTHLPRLSPRSVWSETTLHYTTLHYSSAEESAQRRAVFTPPPLNPQSYQDRGRLLCESLHLFSAQPMHKNCPTRPHTSSSHFNPFEYSPDGQISGLKGARTRLQRVYFPVL